MIDKMNLLIQSKLEECLLSTTVDVPKNLMESIRYSLLAPGKRIRPRLLLGCAHMLQLQTEQVIYAALSVEIIHCFTLIHDDLPCMDNSDFRRGKPSNHKQFGEGIALLCGDALMTLAWEIFLKTPLEPKKILLGLQRLLQATGANGVIGGQASELLLKPSSTLNDLKKVHQKKTGALFSAAILISKDFQEIPDDSIQGKALIQFAKAFGLAFQIADDLEDQENSPTSITYYLSKEESKKLAKKEIEEAFSEIRKNWPDKYNCIDLMVQEILGKLS